MIDNQKIFGVFVELTKDTIRTFSLAVLHMCHIEFWRFTYKVTSCIYFGIYSILFYLLIETGLTFEIFGIITAQNLAMEKEVNKTSPLKNRIALAFCILEKT